MEVSRRVVEEEEEEEEESQLMESKDLFELFDPEGKGFITKQDFHRLITQIPQIDESILDIFDCLDVENKGYLTYEQFSEGFENSTTDEPDHNNQSITPDTSNESSRLNSDLYEQETVEESYDEDLINKILKILDSKDVNYINSVRKKWYALQSRDTDLILFMDELFKKVEQQKEHGRLSHVQLEAALKRRSMAHQEEIRGLFEEIQIRQETEGALACDREQEKKLNEQLLETVNLRELQLQEAARREAELAAKLKQLERTEQMVKMQNEQLLRDKESLELKLRTTSVADWDDTPRLPGDTRSRANSNLSLEDCSTNGDQADDEVFTDQPALVPEPAKVPMQMTQTSSQMTAAQSIPRHQANITAIKTTTTQLSNVGSMVNGGKRVTRVPASKHLLIHDDTDTDISDLPMSPEPRLYSISKQNWGAYQKQPSAKPRPKDKSPQKKSKKSSCPVVPSSNFSLSRTQLSRQGSSLGDYFPTENNTTPRNQSVNCEDGEEIMLIVEPQLESSNLRMMPQRRNSDRVIQDWSGTNGRRSDMSLEAERQDFSHMDSSDEHNGNSLAIGAPQGIPVGGVTGFNTSQSERTPNADASVLNRANVNANQSNLQDINRPIRAMSDQSKITLARAMQNFATSLRKLPVESRAIAMNNLSGCEHIRRKTVASMFNLEEEPGRNEGAGLLNTSSGIDKHPKRHSIDCTSPVPSSDGNSPEDNNSPMIEKLSLTKESITNQWLRKIKTNLAHHEAANLDRVGLNSSQVYLHHQYLDIGGHYDTETTSATNTASESEGRAGEGGAVFSETDFDCSTIKSDSTYDMNKKGLGNLTDDTICSDAYPTILPSHRKKQDFTWKIPQQNDSAVRRRKASKVSPQIDRRKLSQKVKNRKSAEFGQPMMAGSIVRTRVYKIVFVGNSGSGKTSFIQRVCSGEVGMVEGMRFPPATVGVDYRCKNIYCDNFCYSLQLWDTAGQERFQAITRQYMRNADAMLVFYDVTDRRSFASVRSWMESASVEATGGGGHHDQSHLVTLLIANKVDLRTVHSNCVSSSEGALLADECDADFVEISVKADVNINECLSVLVSHLNQEESAKQRRLQLKKDKCNTSSKCCSSSSSSSSYY